ASVAQAVRGACSTEFGHMIEVFSQGMNSQAKRALREKGGADATGQPDGGGLARATAASEKVLTGSRYPARGMLRATPLLLPLRFSGKRLAFKIAWTAVVS